MLLLFFSCLLTYKTSGYSCNDAGNISSASHGPASAVSSSERPLVLIGAWDRGVGTGCAHVSRSSFGGCCSLCCLCSSVVSGWRSSFNRYRSSVDHGDDDVDVRFSSRRGSESIHRVMYREMVYQGVGCFLGLCWLPLRIKCARCNSARGAVKGLAKWRYLHEPVV